MAYLDAGTGSMMLQAVLGGVAGLAVMGRLLRARLARILFFWRRPDVPTTGPVDDAADDLKPDQDATRARA
jgi:hypothetical protein